MYFVRVDIYICYLILTGCTHLLEAVTVTWGVGHDWLEPSIMYINGLLTATVPGRSGKTTHTLPEDARVIAWHFRIVAQINHKFFQVTYSNSWSSRDYQCWKCTGTDVSQLNWADIEYDDSSWKQPQISETPWNGHYDWVYPSGQTIYCRHTLPVSVTTSEVPCRKTTPTKDHIDWPKLVLSNNQIMPVAVADILQDENTGTCVAASEIYGAAMTAIKVNPSLYTGTGVCTLNVTGVGLTCNRLRVYSSADQGSECPKNGPTSRLAVSSQGSGSNGTVWCHFQYKPASCKSCCVGCDKPVLLVFRSSEANVNICEID